MEHIIDAQGKRLGRVASEVASILQGKHSVAYNPRLEGTDKVIIKNASKITLSGKKTSQKIYYRHAGQLGHLKENKFRDVFAKSPAWVIRHAIERMLPKNRLQARRIKRLKIEL
ncbi:MAG: 50S ribosomal protein L13 [Candidatus Jorgensenbacteria bacterium]|nr:50S ribosomal protein L13 [Candidatus Jorgensenbacteria bacterium]